MKFLHTSDWHIGKTLKGRNRIEEQIAVMRQIVGYAIEHDVDAVLIAGDLYETSAPTAEAQRHAIRALVAMAETGIEVIVIAGNHDHGATFEAYKPLTDAAGIHVYGLARPVDEGGVHTFTARSDGSKVNVAVLPFLSQRYAVRAAQMIANTPSENVGAYDQLVRDVLANLTSGFSDDAVNLIMAHLTCTGATFGGGERPAQSILEYHVPAAVFPQAAHYVALGHLHRRQAVPAPCPVHYSGAPFPVDFGEQDNTHVVCLVEASPGLPVKVRDLPVTAGRRLRTAEGTLAALAARAEEFGDDYLRLVLTQATYSGIREEVLAALPNTLEMRIHPDYAETGAKAAIATSGPPKTPAQQFAEYCVVAGVDDPRVNALFDEISDDLASYDRT